MSDWENGAEAFLGLGSSLGDREANLRNALTRLQDQKNRLLAVSSLYESPHMGKQEGDAERYPPHLNIVAKFATRLEPLALLRHIWETEKAGGRQRTEHWGPRTIDIDILLYGDRICQEPNLQTPHPGIAERAFVVLPLWEIAPALVLPDGRSVASLRGSAPILAQKITKMRDWKP